MNFDIRDIIDE